MFIKPIKKIKKTYKRTASSNELPQRIGAMKKKTGLVSKIKHKFLRHKRYKLLGK